MTKLTNMCAQPSLELFSIPAPGLLIPETRGTSLQVQPVESRTDRRGGENKFVANRAVELTGNCRRDGLPVLRDALPVTMNGLPVTMNGLPVTMNGLPVTRHGPPVTRARLPVKMNGLPVTKDELPGTRYANVRTSGKGWIKARSLLNRTGTRHVVAPDDSVKKGGFSLDSKNRIPRPPGLLKSLSDTMVVREMPEANDSPLKFRPRCRTPNAREEPDAGQVQAIVIPKDSGLQCRNSLISLVAKPGIDIQASKHTSFGSTGKSAAEGNITNVQDPNVFLSGGFAEYYKHNSPYSWPGKPSSRTGLQSKGGANRRFVLQREVSDIMEFGNLEDSALKTAVQFVQDSMEEKMYQNAQREFYCSGQPLGTDSLLHRKTNSVQGVKTWKYAAEVKPSVTDSERDLQEKDQGMSSPSSCAKTDFGTQDNPPNLQDNHATLDLNSQAILDRTTKTLNDLKKLLPASTTADFRRFCHQGNNSQHKLGTCISTAERIALSSLNVAQPRRSAALERISSREPVIAKERLVAKDRVVAMVTNNPGTSSDGPGSAASGRVPGNLPGSIEKKVGASDVVNAEKFFGSLAHITTSQLPQSRLASLLGETKRKQLQAATEDKASGAHKSSDSFATRTTVESVGRAGLVYTSPESIQTRAKEQQSRREFVSSYVVDLAREAVLADQKRTALRALWPEVLREMTRDAVREMWDAPAYMKRCLEDLERASPLMSSS